MICATPVFSSLGVAKIKANVLEKNEPLEIIQQNAGVIETISKKDIYQSPYDNVDTEKKNLNLN